MPVVPGPPSIELLRRLAPLDALADEALRRLAERAEVRRHESNAVLFKAGQRLTQILWLIDGAAELSDPALTTPLRIGARDRRATQRLAGPPTASYSGRAVTPTTLLALDGGWVDSVLTWEQSRALEVGTLDDAADADDWMHRLLSAPAIQQLPPTSLHALFRRLQPIALAAGERVIREGEPGEWFYVVEQGRCVVERAQPSGPPLRLAELSAGDSFGEDALVADAPRNASVTMITAGRLMRLARADFLELLKTPLLQRIEPAAAQREIDAGRARWLDVRLPSEFAEGHLPGSRNLPLAMLRAALDSLTREQLQICVCDSGRRAEVAAFVLARHGYASAVLANH